MLGGLDRLQKELDALTYNSRSVMNAMIRSTVVGGTEMGYTVERVKDNPNGKVTLTQPQIYKIFKFYREWENNSFDEAWFDENAVDENLREALANHSKILYMNQGNVDETTGYWLNLIKTANNPKLVTNSAPVPVNLRTPVFDENMATTTYGSNQTFVFPTAYYLLDILGYSADGVEHSMGGKKWSIIADEDLLLDGGHIAIGNRNPSDAVKPPASGNGGNTTAFNISMGTNAYTYGDYSIVGGSNSGISSIGDYSLAIGSRVFGDGRGSVVFGSDNIAAGIGSTVVGGAYNTAISDYSSVFGGNNNQAGGEIYNFKLVEMTMSSTDSTTDYDKCVAACSGYISSDPSINISTTTIYAVKVNGNVKNVFKEGDTIRMFDFTTKFGGKENIKRYDLNGAYYSNKVANISTVSYDESTNVTTITTTGASFESIIDGGKLAKIYTYDKYNQLIGCGMYSATVGGVGLIANGECQVVTGKYNYSTPSSIFSIGVGNYINDRKSILDVGVDYFRICGSPLKSGQVIPNNTYSESYTKEAGFVGFQVFTGNSNYTSNYVEIVNKDSRIHASDDLLEMVFNPRDAINKYGLSIESGSAILSIDSPKTEGTLNTLELKAPKTISIDDFDGLGNVEPAAVDILAEGNVNIGGLKGVNIQAGTAAAPGTLTIKNANVVLNNSAIKQYSSTILDDYSGFYAIKDSDGRYSFEYRNILSLDDYTDPVKNVRGISIGFSPMKNNSNFGSTSGLQWWQKNAFLRIYDGTVRNRFLLTSATAKELLTATQSGELINLHDNLGTDLIGGVKTIQKIYKVDKNLTKQSFGYTTYFTNNPERWNISHHVGINSIGGTSFAYGNIQLNDTNGLDRDDLGIYFSLSEKADFIEQGTYYGVGSVTGWRAVPHPLASNSNIVEVKGECIVKVTRGSDRSVQINVIWDTTEQGTFYCSYMTVISFNFPLKKWESATTA